MTDSFLAEISKTLTSRLAIVNRLTNGEDDLSDDNGESEAIIAIVGAINALKSEKKELELKRKNVNFISGIEDIRKYYDVLDDFRKGWLTLTFSRLN